MVRALRLPNVTEQAVLAGLVVRLSRPEEEGPWNETVIQKHYLHQARLVGEQLRYIAEFEGTWLALLGWSAPAFHLQARDAWIGWSVEQRRTRRRFLAQNSRFLLLVDRHQFPNLGSRALALCCARLPEDWLARHGHPIVAVESFVDAQITFGTTYKASGWTMLGPTAGFGRTAQDFYERHDRPKQLWVRALDPQGTAALKAPVLPPSLAGYELEAAPRCQVAAPRLPSLLDRLPQLKDPRKSRGRWHRWQSVLGILSLAKLAGVPGAQREIAEFAQRLSQPQRRQLGCRIDPQTQQYEVPSQSTFYRALAKVDYLNFEKVVLGWQDDWLGPRDPKELVVLDGKSIANAQGQVMVCAVGVTSGRVYGLEPVRPKEDLEADDKPEVPATLASASSTTASESPALSADQAQTPSARADQSSTGPVAAPKKENEIPAARRLLERAPVAGQLVSLDALHTQHQTAAQIVLGSGADYLFTLKANQDGLLKTAQTLVPSAFFPSGPQAQSRAHGQDRRNQPEPPRGA